jgi:REP-associated tyrosine transposase
LWHYGCTFGNMPFKPVPRLKSFDYVGFYRYFLTICAHGRAQVFVAEDAVTDVLSQLSRTADAEHFSVIAYCFMQDHVHVLTEGMRQDADFRRFVRIFKQRSSFHWKRRTGAELWQRSYFEHVLRDDEDSFGVARYILANPVRAGIVTSPEDYPFVGSLTMTVRDLLYSIQMDPRPT